MDQHKDQPTLTITSAINDRWLTLDPDTRAQHILCNSDLYQQVKLMQHTLSEFRRLEEQNYDHNQ